MTSKSRSRFIFHYVSAINIKFYDIVLDSSRYKENYVKSTYNHRQKYTKIIYIYIYIFYDTKMITRYHNTRFNFRKKTDPLSTRNAFKFMNILRVKFCDRTSLYLR